MEQELRFSDFPAEHCKGGQHQKAVLPCFCAQVPKRNTENGATACLFLHELHDELITYLAVLVAANKPLEM